MSVWSCSRTKIHLRLSAWSTSCPFPCRVCSEIVCLVYNFIHVNRFKKYFSFWSYLPMLISPTDLCCVALATKLADPAPSRVCLFISWLCCMACGILVFGPGIKSMVPALGAWSLNYWTAFFWWGRGTGIFNITVSAVLNTSNKSVFNGNITCML